MLVTKQPYRRLSLQAATLVQATIFLAAAQTNTTNREITNTYKSSQKQPTAKTTASNETSLTGTYIGTNVSVALCTPHASCKIRSELDHVDRLSEFICQCDEECRMYDDCCPDAEHESPQTIPTTTATLTPINPNRTAVGLIDGDAATTTTMPNTTPNDPLNSSDRIEARNRWHCQQIDDGPEGALVMSSCPPNWSQDVAGMTHKLARQIELRCNFARGLIHEQQPRDSLAENSSSNTLEGDLWNVYKSDPLGTMIPITDLLTGITYANSYCLRCNREIIRKNQQLNSINAMQFVKPKLVSWKPIIKCNFQAKANNKVSLIELVRRHKDKALEYSVKLNKWLVNTHLMEQATNMSQDQQQQSQASSQRNKLINLVLSNQRARLAQANEASQAAFGGGGDRQLCTLEPTPRDSSRSVLRACRADTIRTCMNLEATDKLHWDCLKGKQSLVFSKRRAGIAYHNFACALCNDEQLDSISCEPLISQQQSFKQETNELNAQLKQQINPLLVIQHQWNRKKENNKERKTTSISTSTSSPATQSTLASFMKAPMAPFSVLIDMFGNSSHQCPGLHQVYDPFFTSCRCLVCGLNRFYREGRCVDRTSNKVSEIT